MVELIHEGVYYKDGQLFTGSELAAQGIQADAGKGAKKTLAYQVLEAHQQGAGMEDLHLKFDALTSHDITYVGRAGSFSHPLHPDQLPQQLGCRGGNHQ